MNRRLFIFCISIFIILGVITYLIKLPNKNLFEAKWNNNNTLAITIDGEISTTFPTTNAYEGTVTCTTGTGSVSWNGTKWVMTTSGITRGSTKCNVNFIFSPTWENPGSNTLLAKIKSNNNVVSTSTYPGQQVSTSNEAILSSKADDYGTSYYFRGNVTNNYVEYANMCWRIVRVTGNAGIKLVLYNYNGLSNTNTVRNSSTPCNVTGSNLSYMRLDNSLYFKFNEEGMDNAYEGLMYGSPNSSSYAASHANVNVSTIVTSLNTWYKNVLLKQNNFKEDYLVDTIWCNDKNVITDTTYDPWDVGYNVNFGFGTNLNYYKTTQRLYNRVNNMVVSTPSFVCSNDNNGGKLSKFTVNDTKYGNGALRGYAKIGMLTADEIAFAGGAYGENNTNYYLYKNASAEFWWTISPSNYFGFARVWYASKNGNLAYDGYVQSNNVAARPSITLSSKVKWSEGVGTASSPYRIF